ncbi:craniofacial development protein 1-like [Lingula anatina]|uniref:Craniofacial development protein 1 n=1 Tax=Lingula anatina TaxID=7574 RepID=A0A1S3J1X1_LINAN|nr:craniofacial development protein 1-like [Lingula anatina]|eukprot:XP_013404432.1 craniofacial development protein 1-like [Lingula anatina]
MMAEEGEEDNLSSDSDDEDYVPSGGDEGSEEEASGEEEELSLLKEDDIENGINKNTKKRKGKTKGRNDKESFFGRKRKGGIKLEDEDKDGKEDDEQQESNIVEEMKKEQEDVKELKEKQKADDLWASFLSDVGQKPKPKPASVPSGLGSLSSVTSIKPKSVESAADLKAPPPENTASKEIGPQKITVTKVFDFAGEEVKVTKEIEVNSKEGKKELERMEKEKSTDVSKPGMKRPMGLGSVLGKIGKKPKLSTLTKSALDWNKFKTEEGIEEELQIHNRGKSGYLERQAFLQRTDLRQFELEKDMRLKNSKRFAPPDK